MYVSFEIEGEKQISRKLQDIATKDFQKEFEKAGQRLERFYGNDVFVSEGTAIGEHWADGPNYHALQRTGRMRSGYRHQSTKFSLFLWNIVDYFKYHQSNKPRSRLPRRVMLKLDKTRKKWVIEELQKGVQEILKNRSPRI